MNRVLCHGALCADLRLYLPRYPRPGDGVRVGATRWTPGGNALIEARALIQAGATVTLTGDKLGYDAAGDLLAAELARLNLADGITRSADAVTPVCHILISPDGERSILAIRSEPQAGLPTATQIAASRIVSVTRYGPFTVEVSVQARAAERPLVVGDALTPDDPLVAHADVVVTSARLLAATDDPLEDVIHALHTRRRATIIVSDGPRPARVVWFADGQTHYAEIAPPTITTTDSTGAGDVLRAGVVLGMLHGRSWPETLHQACILASGSIRT
jgi:sugar/nucleoside kinase (ribokinase family)